MSSMNLIDQLSQFIKEKHERIMQLQRELDIERSELNNAIKQIEQALQSIKDVTSL